MRAPSVKRLCEEFKIESKTAHHVRRLAKLADDGENLATFIAKNCPKTHAYARSCYNDPFDSQIWRVTMALHAINDLVGGCGVEGLGTPRERDYAPPYEYINQGDPYVTTLIYRMESDNLFIGSWGPIAERHPSWP